MPLNKRTPAPWFALLAGALVMLGLALPVQANDKPAPTPGVGPAEKVELFSGKIEKLDPEAKTLLVARQTYLVAETTKLMDKDKAIKFEDLKVGTEIHGLAKKNDAGKYQATIIKLGPMPSDDKDKPHPDEAKPSK